MSQSTCPVPRCESCWSSTTTRSSRGRERPGADRARTAFFDWGRLRHRRDQERVRLLGGEVVAGSGSNGGWVVRARLSE